jgi:hypothetical protein
MRTLHHRAVGHHVLTMLMALVVMAAIERRSGGRRCHTVLVFGVVGTGRLHAALLLLLVLSTLPQGMSQADTLRAC